MKVTIDYENGHVFRGTWIQDENFSIERVTTSIKETHEHFISHPEKYTEVNKENA